MTQRLPWLRRAAPDGAESLKWLAVLDSNVIVAAILTSNPRSPNREVIELALAGVFVGVTSDYIRGEVEQTLIEEANLDRELIDAALSPVWRTLRRVEPVTETEELRRAVSDEDDRPILCTALGTYGLPDFAPLPRKFIVSENTAHFVPHRNLYGFECATSGGFLAEIRRSR